MNGKDENQHLKSQVEQDFSTNKRSSSEKDIEHGDTDHLIKKAKVEGKYREQKRELMYLVEILNF